MLKQSPSRNQKVKGFKVKHALQIFLLLAICIWLVYQLKHSHDKKALEESSAKVSGQVQNEHGTIELGRRGGLHPRVEETLLDVGRHREKEEESEEEEVDENKAEESEEEGRVDRHYQEKSEEESEGVEDLIDKDDTEREEESEEQENEDKGNDLENLSLEDQVLNEDTRNTQEAREEHYKGDDASSAVKQNTRARSNRIEIGRLRRVKEEEVESAEIIDLEKDNKATGEKRGNQFGSVKIDGQRYTISSTKVNGTEMLPKLYHDSVYLLAKGTHS